MPLLPLCPKMAELRREALKTLHDIAIDEMASSDLDKTMTVSVHHEARKADILPPLASLSPFRFAGSLLAGNIIGSAKLVIMERSPHMRIANLLDDLREQEERQAELLRKTQEVIAISARLVSESRALLSRSQPAKSSLM
ncbi:hypothetical protein EOA23_09200 [Mesorhizobium sp. M2A.F.Ca.ET.042.01.1.1]|uniref:hypothetical protein n=1 Tax=Mesorhizobium sp. M2A.F.Ca.ET.042.01.1.1 TaxID=2496745 RepID=UPI000FCB0937|nr:hypothetical protein [Mesorhizobium sp. M2A.F.Ca.ET.042.01.1.1]RUX32396.1 hypothetical protein EOA23_09200 [Mesorhizobium sp. M2A.F.Ca.ET.042.01.1.1]